MVFRKSYIENLPKNVSISSNNAIYPYHTLIQIMANNTYIFKLS